MTKPIVFAKFMEPEILGESGRLLFSLLQAFSQNGYRIQLFNNLSCESTGKLGRATFALPGLLVVNTIPVNIKDTIFLYDKADRSDLRRGWLKTVKIRFDIFSNYLFRAPILFPYPPHPVHTSFSKNTRSRGLRDGARYVRLFFPGI